MSDYTPPVYERIICNIAPEGFDHAERREDYNGKRAKHIAAMTLETNPPVEGDVETLKARVENVEGEELPKLKHGDTYRVYKQEVYDPVMSDADFARALSGEAPPLEYDLAVYLEGETQIMEREFVSRFNGS